MSRRIQQQRTAEARRRLIDAATKLIGTKGYRGTTLVEIGREAGISRSLVTYHFGSKEACLSAVLEDIRAWTTRFIGGDGEGRRGLASLAQLTERYLQSYPKGQPAARAIFATLVESIDAGADIRALTIETDNLFRETIAQMLREAVEDGELDDSIDVGIQAVLITGLLRGIALQWLVCDSAVDLDTVITEAIQMWRTRLVRQPPIAS